jgi:hypothetical protein
MHRNSQCPILEKLKKKNSLPGPFNGNKNCLLRNKTEKLCSKMEKTEVDDLKNGMEKERCKINYFQAGLRIRIRIRIRRIRMFLGFLDPDPSS